MTKEELDKEAEEYVSKYQGWGWTPHKGSAVYNAMLNSYIDSAEPREKRITELEAQIEKLIDFVLSKIECCDVCPITDTCINSEGTCPYASILVKGEKEVTREWIMQFISRR